MTGIEYQIGTAGYEMVVVDSGPEVAGTGVGITPTDGVDVVDSILNETWDKDVCVIVTGQIEVDTTMMSVVVVALCDWRGQSVTLEGQARTVTKLVEKAVDVEIVGQMLATTTADVM